MDIIASESVDTFDRNGWSTSIGMGGQDGPEYAIVKAHSYNDHGWKLYEAPGPNPPTKQCSRWNRLVDRAAVIQKAAKESQLTRMESEEVECEDC